MLLSLPCLNCIKYNQRKYLLQTGSGTFLHANKFGFLQFKKLHIILYLSPPSWSVICKNQTLMTYATVYIKFAQKQQNCVLICLSTFSRRNICLTILQHLLNYDYLMSNNFKQKIDTHYYFYTPCSSLWQAVKEVQGTRCSSEVECLLIAPWVIRLISHGGPTELFVVPASPLQLV